MEMNINTVQEVIDDNRQLPIRALEAHSSNDNPSYSHREAGDNACGLDQGTAHAHK